jgi:glycosyltransferase involved in cell wall biosynthesis
VRFVTLGEVLPAPGVEVHTRPIPRNPFQALAALRGFLRDVRSFDPDLLHLNYAGGRLGTLATLAGIHPLVAAVVGGDVLSEQHPGGHSWPERRATRRILESADLILVKNEALRAAVAGYGDFTAKIETVRWGVDPSRFRRDIQGAAALRRRLDLAPEDRVVLSPRLLRPLYNIHLVVAAMPAVLAAFPRSVLLVTEYNADPVYRGSLQEWVHRHGLVDRVRFIGRVDHQAMPTLYSMADVMVSVPASDGLPQSLFEAMACGTPVVLGRLPVYAEVVTEGESALLADLEPAAVAAAINRVLGNPALAGALARNALLQLERTALLPREVERVEALYRDLVTRGARQNRSRGRLGDALGLLLR